MIRFALALILCGTFAQADIVVAARTIPAQTVLGPDDLSFRDIAAVGAISDPADAIGKEARVALFAGRPIRIEDVGEPAVVERNQIIPLIFDSNGLYIKTDGRALDRAGPGDVIRVMNLQSRNTVTATIRKDGSAYVAR